jgi:hypothetical protein
MNENVTIEVAYPELLRDYFLRLGADAWIADAGTIRVDTAAGWADELTVADCVRHWSTVNGVAATVVLAPPAPRPAAPPPVEQPTFFLERPRLGDLLLKRGLITQDQLERALAESRETGDLLGRVMIRRQFIFEDELARTVADQLDLPYVNLHVTGFDRSTAMLVPSHEGMRIAALPVGVFAGQVRVAFADPMDEASKALVREHVGDFTLAVADLSAIEEAWRALDPSCGVARVA